MPGDFQFDLFLSHNRAQKDWTRELARRLRDDGFAVWFDEWELPKHAGADWIEGLRIGVNQSRKIVLVWSPEFFANEWPVFESRIIQLRDPVGRKQRVIPILHSHCEIPEEWGFRQALNFVFSHLGPLEYDFCYQQLAYNLDNSRPFEGDFARYQAERTRAERTQAERTGAAVGGKLGPDPIPPVSPLPKGSRMPYGSNPLFVGRERELRELARSLTPGSGGAAGLHAAVTGMGGVGKTLLAIEYAHRYGRLYSGGVYWLNLEKPENAMNEVARCGGPEGMDLDGFANLSLPDQAAKVRQVWQDGSARLLVFDNAEDSAMVEHWRPKTGRCSLLITGRRSDWPPQLGLRPLAVETLPRPQSLEMLEAARAEIKSDADARHVADQICEQLGDLPLALRVSSDYLRKYKGEPLHEYLEALRAQPSPDGELKDVWASFSVSYNKLDPASESHALAQRLFHLASHFAPVSISRELLAASAGFDYEKKPARHSIDDALARLRDLGLASEEPDGRILLHRLLRDFARLHPPAATAAQEAAQAVAQAVFEIANRENKTGLPQKLARELPHLRLAAAEADRRGSTLTGPLYHELGYHLDAVAAYPEARVNYERALKISEAALGPDHPNVAIHVNGLGTVLRNLGDLAGAKASFERALRIDEAALAPNHPQVAIEVNNLGNVLQDLGDLAGAEACYERALKIAETALGPHHPQVAIRVNNLGRVLQDLGDLAGAKACIERALKINEAVYGMDHPQVATSVNNLGLVLKDQGDLAGAKACFERALRIFTKALGEDHPNTRTVRRNLEALG